MVTRETTETREGQEEERARNMKQIEEEEGRVIKRK